MRKHQFAKSDCNCHKRATVYACRHCGALEYKSPRELRRLSKRDATCPSEEAPRATSQEVLKAGFGGVFDCLVPEEGN
ncbi:hypothetical protein [Desulfohalovibrio reitneri]|uniref:hypothetical protein n=1 Tax=Desulfohalovibrio reitneri TaxID=1307759 RepID=UPI0004A70767|nr:hypothetical protein [Desulfohalovibrio reitneri]